MEVGISFQGFSSDTQVKTNHGWKNIQDVSVKYDKVLAFDPKSFELHYIMPKEVRTKNVSGYLYRFEHNAVDTQNLRSHCPDALPIHPDKGPTGPALVYPRMHKWRYRALDRSISKAQKTKISRACLWPGVGEELAYADPQERCHNI